MKQLLNMPKLKLETIEYTTTNLDIIGTFRSKRSKCPICEKYSYSIHGCYTRLIMDLPVFQCRTVIHLRTRKFKCKKQAMHQKGVFRAITIYLTILQKNHQSY